MDELKDAVLCQVHAAFNAGAATLQLKALPGMPPWRLPPTTTDAGSGTYGKPTILLTLMDVANRAAAKIEIIRCTFSGVDIGGGVYEAENCERGLFGTDDQAWDPGELVMMQVTAAHLALETELAVMLAGQVLTHPNTKVVTWDGSKMKWDRFRAIGVGRGPHWSSIGFFDIVMPGAPYPDAIGYGGAADQTFDANGITIPQNTALYYELPIGENGAVSIKENFRLVTFTADFVVPKHWLLLAVHEYNGAVGDSILRCATGATLVPWREIGSAGSPAFENSWVNFGGARATAAFRKTGDETVFLKGTIKTGAIGDACFTLPAGYRPEAERAFPVESNGAFGAFTIGADGVVTPTVGSSTSFCLDGIAYRAQL